MANASLILSKNTIRFGNFFGYFFFFAWKLWCVRCSELVKIYFHWIGLNVCIYLSFSVWCVYFVFAYEFCVNCACLNRKWNQSEQNEAEKFNFIFCIYFIFFPHFYFWELYVVTNLIIHIRCTDSIYQASLVYVLILYRISEFSIFFLFILRSPINFILVSVIHGKRKYSFLFRKFVSPTSG